MKKCRGTSLVELLVAMFLLASLVVFIFSVFPAFQGRIEHGENRINAAYLARTVMDDARRTAFDNLTVGTYPGTVNPNFSPQVGERTVTSTNNGVASKQTFNVSLVVADSGAERKTLTATVTWPEGGTTRTFTMQGVVVEP